MKVKHWWMLIGVVVLVLVALKFGQTHPNFGQRVKRWYQPSAEARP